MADIMIKMEVNAAAGGKMTKFDTGANILIISNNPKYFESPHYLLRQADATWP